MDKRNRKEEVFRRELKKFGQICSICHRPKRIVNDKCAKCMKLMGIKKCYECGEIKLIELGFYKKRGICRECLKQRMALL
jgi:hypothetical protein